MVHYNESYCQAGRICRGGGKVLLSFHTKGGRITRKYLKNILFETPLEPAEQVQYLDGQIAIAGKK